MTQASSTRRRVRQVALAGASSATALAGSGMVGPTTEAVEAGVVYNMVDITVPATTAGLYINVETLATNANPGAVPGWDLNPWGSSTLGWFKANTPAGGTMMVYPGNLATAKTGNLALNTTVDATSTYSTDAAGTVVFGAGAGEWKLNDSNLFGFRFTASDSQTHFGWGRMDVGASNLIRSIKELAWEDVAGVGITVGAGRASAVPEPGSLALMASGAAGLLAWRLRRRPEPTPVADAPTVA